MGISIGDEYEKNYNAIAATTKGSNSQGEVLLAAVTLTIFAVFLSYATSPNAAKMD